MTIISTIITDIQKYWNECWKQALFAGGVLCLIYLGIKLLSVNPAFSHNRRKNRLISDLFYFFLMGTYGYFLIYITFSMRTPGFRREVNLIPFSSMDANSPELRFVIENFLLFIPFGMLLPLCIARLRKIFCIIICSAAVSAGIEILQYLLSCGKTETDDVIMNTLGACAGYFVFLLLRVVYRFLKIKQ